MRIAGKERERVYSDGVQPDSRWFLAADSRRTRLWELKRSKLFYEFDFPCRSRFRRLKAIADHRVVKQGRFAGRCLDDWAAVRLRIVPIDAFGLLHVIAASKPWRASCGGASAVVGRMTELTRNGSQLSLSNKRSAFSCIVARTDPLQMSKSPERTTKSTINTPVVSPKVSAACFDVRCARVGRGGAVLA
jgi:hypothetical protein